MESRKHGNTLGTTAPSTAGPAATLRPSAQERHTPFAKDRFPSRPCDTCPAPQQLTDCSCGRCRPPSDPPTGHPNRERCCRLDSRTPRRTDSPARPGSQGDSQCRASTEPGAVHIAPPRASCLPGTMPGGAIVAHSRTRRALMTEFRSASHGRTHPSPSRAHALAAPTRGCA